MAAVGSMPANGLKGETITRLSIDMVSKPAITDGSIYGQS